MGCRAYFPDSAPNRKASSEDLSESTSTTTIATTTSGTDSDTSTPASTGTTTTDTGTPLTGTSTTDTGTGPVPVVLPSCANDPGVGPPTCLVVDAVRAGCVRQEALVGPYMASPDPWLYQRFDDCGRLICEAYYGGNAIRWESRFEWTDAGAALHEEHTDFQWVGSGVDVDYIYDGADRLIEQAHTYAGLPIFDDYSLIYEHDDADPFWERWYCDGCFPVGVSGTVTWDLALGLPLRREVEHDGYPGIDSIYAYTYDAVGHELTYTSEAPPNGVAYRYTSTWNGGVMTLREYESTGNGVDLVEDFTHDGSGRQLQRNQTDPDTLGELWFESTWTCPGPIP